MKKVLVYTAFAAALMTGTSCGDGFLDKSPELSVSETLIFTSATRLEAGVTGVYTRMKHDYFLGGYATVAGDNRSDDMINYGNNGYTMRDTYSHSVNASCIENDRLMYRAYLGINYANILIDGLENTYAGSLPCDDATAQVYLQECKFLRAIAYYYLSQLFGQPYSYSPTALNVPLRTEPSNGAGFNDCPAATITEVFNQILADTENVSSLPVGFGDSSFDATKASQAAAHMLRMRVYMCMQQWDNAIAEGQKVQGFGLISNLGGMFELPYAMTEENIFSIPMSTTDRSGTQAHPAGYFTSAAGDITCVNDINGIATYYNVPADARTAFLSSTGGRSFYQKYNDLGTRLQWIPIFRYGETLLNLSECYYNKGMESEALATLKQVRTRSIAASADPLVSYTESGAALWTAIDNERRWEFLTEGIRGYDISRRGEEFRHPLTTGEWTVVATPSDRTTYCWAFPLYETTVNPSLSN